MQGGRITTIEHPVLIGIPGLGHFRLIIEVGILVKALNAFHNSNCPALLVSIPVNWRGMGLPQPTACFLMSAIAGYGE